MSTVPLWREIQRQNFTKVRDLAHFLQLSESQIQELDETPAFVLNVPQRLAKKMQKGTLDDPLFKQFVPLKKERLEAPGYLLDPVADMQAKRQAKLLHKYEGRALVITTSACAMHCRYCFRKNFPYETKTQTFEKELEILENDTTIQEVLLSGGDPLSLSDLSLEALLTSLSRIRHVKRVRFHTRFIMGIPERITDGFLALLQDYPKQIWFVIHANAACEFDADIWQALKKIQKLGIPVLCQSVLLKGVNDHPDALVELSSVLIDHGITPYYLHQLDPVQGSQHFEVSENEGLKIIAEAQKKLPGYGVPKYVREDAGEPSKTILG